MSAPERIADKLRAIGLDAPRLGEPLEGAWERLEASLDKLLATVAAADKVMTEVQAVWDMTRAWSEAEYFNDLHSASMDYRAARAWQNGAPA